MDRNKILEIVTEIFQDVFDDNEIVLNDLTDAEDIEDWDSLAQITLIASIEKTFDITFSMKDIIGLKNVGEMIDLIEKSL